MRRLCLTLLLPSLLGGCAAHLATNPSAETGSAPVQVTPPRPERERLLGRLPLLLRVAEPDERFPVLVEMRRQVDLEALAARMESEGLDRTGRRRAVAEAAETVAARTAAGFEPFLARLEARGRIESWEGYAIANRYWAMATPAGIRRLARRREVDTIRWTEDRPRAGRPLPSLPRSGTLLGSEGPATPPRPGDRVPDPHAWGPEAIGAPELWARGWTGAGIVVADLDTGADPAHEQLQGGFRGGDSSWFDPDGGREEPWDSTGHGTGVLSCAVGRNPGGSPVGVAPGARWVAGRVTRGGRTHLAAVLSAADWVLLEAQPDVVVNPWAVEEFSCEKSWDRVVAVWRLAEIFPVFAAGNAGPSEGSNTSPSNTTGLPPDGGRAFSVGAAQRSGTVAGISSRGPNRCDGGTYPSVCAPGYLLRIAEPNAPEGYRVGWGSSFAAGQAGGGVALLLEAFPEARVVELEAALRETARDTGPPGPDNECGHGLLDLPAAVEWLEARGEREGAQ